MFNIIEEVISIIVGSILLITTFIGFIVSVIKSFRNKKLASTVQKTNDITDLAIDKVAEIENLYSQASNMLKVMGITTGEIKKENVMNFIESKCNERNINFDSEYWSATVEKIVSLMNIGKEAMKKDGGSDLKQ